MYYRRTSYPASGLSDIPDDLWEEFQRIRSHLSSVDQNNVSDLTIKRDTVARPTGTAREGISDIVDTSGDFLYDERFDASGFKTIGDSKDDQWYNLANKGVVLRTKSRGDAPWLVGVSVSCFVDPGQVGELNRGNLRLRVRSSSEGLSAAEAVGGFNQYCNGCCISTVASFLVAGGPVEFSPVVSLNSIFNKDPAWKVKITHANIFAVGLYR